MDEVHDILWRVGGIKLIEEIRVSKQLDEGLQGAQVRVAVLSIRSCF